MSSLEFRSSEPLDQAASQVNSGSDSIAREVQNQFSSVASVGKDAAMAAMPGTDAMAGLGAIPPGGEQAVSPLINMITKMPGHIGLFSSFFEALGAFFGPQLEALSQIGTHLGMTLGIDQSLLGNLGGNHLASALNAFKPEHFGLNLSLLPGNAPFFGQIGMNIGSGQLPGHLSGSFNSDLLSSKLNTSLGQGGEPFSQQAFGRNALNVSGSGNMAKLQFEGQGHLSGPGLSANMPAAQIAGNNRLFSDSIGSAGHNLNAQSMAQSLPMQTPSATSLNVGSSTFGEPINNDLLAMGNQSDSFQSTVGSARPSIDTVKGGAENLGGLKAKPLSLDGHNGNLKADALGDSQALDNKVAAKHDAVAPKADHAVKHSASHKLDHAKAEAKPEARTHKTFDRTSHSVKTSNHHASQSTAKAVTNNKPQVEAQQQELNPQQQFEQQQLGQQQQIQQQQMQQQQEVAQNNQPLEQGQQAQSANSLEPRSYTIRSGDNLWNIAKDNLGDATKWNDIYKMNTDVLGANPELIRPGTTIQLPGSQSADIASAATPGAAGQYTVQSGDTLWDIAHDQLGDATKWGDIYKANSELIGSDPGMIHPGQQLSLGTVDPSNQLASASGAVGGQNLASVAPGQLANAPLPQTNVNVDVQPTAQAPIESYGAEAGMPQDMQSQAMQAQPIQAQPMQSQQTQSQVSSMSNYEAMPVQRINQLPDPASLGEKVIPAKAQPDVLIQPAHAAAPGQFDSAKPAVNSTLANDMLSFLKKRR